MSTNPFSSDDADESSGTRPNFIAQIVRSEVDTEDEDLQGNPEYESDYDVLYELDVLDADYSNMYELGIDVRESLASKWKVLMGHLENIHGPDTIRNLGSLEELAEFLDGRVYEFKDQDMTADEDFTFEHKGDGHTINFMQEFGDYENPPNSTLLPVREVTDNDELADLGVEDSGTVEEAEF
jgi:hypothetical protein